ncbi:MAG: response regulator [Bdellovibrionales bacterium]|nr:response regulator [Bdellovibrionales bacterium]
MNVLIIDDEPEIGFILCLELKILGHNCVSFETTALAQNHLLAHSTDVIICDFQMPKMNGLDFFYWARLNAFNGPFFILTGEPAMGTKHLLDQGITQVLFKPQDLNKLIELLK